MSISRVGTLLLGVALIALLLGCNALALGGAKKYKVDLQNILMNIQDEVDRDGMVSDRTYNKFKGFMDKYQEEYGRKGSYIKAKNVLEHVTNARGDSENGFMEYQKAKMEITLCQDLLKTEVQE
jgi:hypothetical protein